MTPEKNMVDLKYTFCSTQKCKYETYNESDSLDSRPKITLDGLDMSLKSIKYTAD